MASEEAKKWPGYTGVAYPDVFTNAPPQPKKLKPGQLSEEQVKKFFEEGYLLIESFFTKEELDPAKDAVNDLVEELAQKLYKAGKTTSLYSEYGYDKRLTMLEAEFPGANILLHKVGKLPKAFQDIWANERILNVAEQILGTSDIMGHPVWNLRAKTPGSKAATVPWHQDTAYLDLRSYDVMQLTGWIPLVNATKETGCVQMIRYGHKTGLTTVHQCCADGTWYVMLSEDEMKNSLGCDLEKDLVTCEVPYGGVLLFNNLIPHQSLMNNSDIIRWSLDMRWQPADHDVGFYDLKQGVRLRSSADPNLAIDWSTFDTVNRSHVQEGNPEVQWHSGKEDFETVLTGPWMLKWELTNKTRHTEGLTDASRGQWGHLIVG